MRNSARRGNAKSGACRRSSNNIKNRKVGESTGLSREDQVKRDEQAGCEVGKTPCKPEGKPL